MPPDPKIKPVRLKGKARSAFKLRLYMERAKGHCESCGRYIPFSGGTVFEIAHLIHIKSVGSGGGDTEENCKIGCFSCHIENGHLKWRK